MNQRPPDTGGPDGQTVCSFFPPFSLVWRNLLVSGVVFVRKNSLFFRRRAFYGFHSMFWWRRFHDSCSGDVSLTSSKHEQWRSRSLFRYLPICSKHIWQNHRHLMRMAVPSWDRCEQPSISQLMCHLHHVLCFEVCLIEDTNDIWPFIGSSHPDWAESRDWGYRDAFLNLHPYP